MEFCGHPSNVLKASAKSLAANLPHAAATLFLICGALASHAQPAPVHIKIINAKTNQPVTNERLNVALRADQIGSVAMATDKNGVILVDTGNATTIRILANMNADCRPRAELYTDYPIATILKNGVTTGNLCSSASPRRSLENSSSMKFPRPTSQPIPTGQSLRCLTRTRTHINPKATTLTADSTAENQS